jgi:hypothetical protein
MRSPSHLRPRVSRAVAFRAALGAVLTSLVLVPAAAAAPGDRGVFVSKGVGRVIFVGGLGPKAVFYGTVFSGGSLVVTDYSATQDMKVESPVVPTTNVDGSRTYSPPAGSTKGLGFRITGSVYRLTVTGSSSLSAFGVYGRLQLRGKGTLSVDGIKNRWNAPWIKLRKIPRAVRTQWDLAFANAPVPAPPAPPEPPPPVTTTGTSPADTVRTDGS